MDDWRARWRSSNIDCAATWLEQEVERLEAQLAEKPLRSEADAELITAMDKHIAELDERLRVQDQWRKELEAENERLKQLRSNTLEYAWDCRRNGYRVMALSVITALEGEQG